MAAGFLGTLAVGVSLNTKPLADATKDARKHIKSIADGAAALGERLDETEGGAQATAALAEIAAAALDRLKEGFKTVAETKGTADSLGIATEKLIGLRRAAELTGATTDDLDKGLATLSKNLKTVGADAESGPAKALERLGIASQTLLGLTPDAQLSAIADGLLGIADPAERAQLAYDLLGSSAESLNSTLALGSAGFAAAQREAERLGETFTDADAEKVKRFEAATRDMQAAITGLFQELAIALAPALEELINYLTEIIVIVRVAVNWVGSLVAGWEGLGTHLKIAATFIIGATAAIAAIVIALKAWATAQAIVLALSGPGGWAAIAVGVAVATATVVGITAATSGLSNELKAAQVEARNANRGTNELADGLETQRKATDDATKALERQRKELEQRGASITQSLRTPAEIFRDQITELNTLVTAGVVTWETYRRGVKRAKDELSSAIDAKDSFDTKTELTPALQRGTSAAFNAVETSKRAAADERRERELADRRDALLSRIHGAIETARPAVTVKAVSI